MRRALGALVVVALMAIPLLASAGEPYEYYRDEFKSVSYDGNDGSLWFASSWYEYGDDGSPASGAVHVDVDGGCHDYKCIHIEASGEISTLGAKRYADLSVFETAEICYELAVLLEEGLGTDASIDVQVSKDGQGWKTVASYDPVDLDGRSIHPQISLNDHLYEGFVVRFVVNGVFHGAVFLDDVEIKGVTVSSTSSTSSTTTTTKPSTTTSKPSRTTTTKATTTTTAESTTTTTVAPETTTTARVTTSSTDPTTTSTSTTSTTIGAALPPPVEPPTDNGLRETDQGVQANFEGGLFGDMDDMEGAEVLPFAVEAEYSMAVELVSASWIWIVALLLLIATAIVSGLDRRRMDRGASA